MVKIEALENNQVKVTVELSGEEFKEYRIEAYRKTGKRYSVPGFRKGKLAPKKVIESYYGESVFFEEAFENAYNKIIPEAIRENDLYPSQPELDISTVGVKEGLVFSAIFDKNAYLNLGEYKGIELRKTEYTVHKKDVEERVEHRIEHVKEDNARIVAVDRNVENGDVLNINYSGSVDGVKFDGGTAENQNLTIGSGSFIPGFEEQLIGMAKDETRDIKVTFPEDYHAKQLAGKEAVFTVKVNSISVKEYPELDDEFASEISDFDTFEAYRKSIYKEEESKIRAEHENKKINDAVKKALENCESFVPEDMIREQAETMARENMERFGAYGMDIEKFCEMVNIDPVEFVGQYKETAKMRIQSEMMLGKIAEAEKIEFTDADVEAEAKKLVDQYSNEQTTDEQKKSMHDMLMMQQRGMLEYQMRLEKAQSIIMDNVVMK